MTPERQIPPRITSPARFGLAGAISFAAAGLALACVLYLFNPVQHGFYPICVFHRVTGLQCPGCGALRASHELLHGQFAAAFHLNPLFVLSLPLVAGWTLRAGLRKLRGAPAGEPVSTRVIWACLIVFVLFGIVRNIPGNPL